MNKKPEKKEFNANENAIQTGLRMTHNKAYDAVMAWHKSEIEKLADEGSLSKAFYEAVFGRPFALAQFIAQHIRKEL